nr:hypothetical protein [Deltaproteobacteria bacterium]
MPFERWKSAARPSAERGARAMAASGTKRIARTASTVVPRATSAAVGSMRRRVGRWTTATSANAMRASRARLTGVPAGMRYMGCHSVMRAIRAGSTMWPKPASSRSTGWTATKRARVPRATGPRAARRSSGVRSRRAVMKRPTAWAQRASRPSGALEWRFCQSTRRAGTIHAPPGRSRRRSVAEKSAKVKVCGRGVTRKTPTPMTRGVRASATEGGTRRRTRRRVIATPRAPRREVKRMSPRRPSRRCEA